MYQSKLELVFQVENNVGRVLPVQKFLLVCPGRLTSVFLDIAFPGSKQVPESTTPTVMEKIKLDPKKGLVTYGQGYLLLEVIYNIQIRK